MLENDHPVVLEKFFHDLWFGCNADGIIGELAMMTWPDEHPDNYCHARKYTPNMLGVCECGWVPKNQVCSCGYCGDTMRTAFEKKLLVSMVSASQIDVPKNDLCALYMEYCEVFAGKIKCTPDLNAVVEWFSGLKEERRAQIIEKHIPKRPMGPTIDDLVQIINSLLLTIDDAPKDFEDFRRSIFECFPDNLLVELGKDKYFSEEIVSTIHDILEKRKLARH